MKSLRSNLTKKDLQEVLEAYKKYDSLEKVNAYINRIINANKPIAKEVFAVSEETIDFILECFEENGTLARVRANVEEKKARDTAIAMLEDGFSPEQIARYVKMPLEWVKSLSG